MNPRNPTRWLKVIGPGILVAATGVGTGDLATGAIVGSRLGVAVLWAVLVGAALKFVLNEGLARWQLATGETVLEGVVRHFGRVAQCVFLVYLLAWTYFTAVALISACGVAMHALLPLGKPDEDKVAYGIAHSLAAVALIELGGYRLFQRVMRVCIAVMFVTVLLTAIALGPSWSEVLSGLLVPSIPDFRGEGLRWTVALTGGVGGTLTILCYGYWIREEGRERIDELGTCRVDLGVGYLFTALFGVAMVIIGSRIDVQGKSAALLVHLSEELASQLGRAAQWTFLIGAWGAIFSSLLGVWQSVPYLFSDFLRLSRDRVTGSRTPEIRTRAWPYRMYLYGMATIPLVGLFRTFETVQKAYAVFGALFIPLLAVALLLLCGSARIGAEHRNRPLTNVVLATAVGLFLVYGYFEIFGR